MKREEEKKRIEKKNYASSKELLTSIKENEERNIAYCFPSPEKQTHCLSLWKKIGKHESFGEKPHVVGFNGKGRVAHPVHNEHYTSHK